MRARRDGFKRLATARPGGEANLAPALADKKRLGSYLIRLLANAIILIAVGT
jgi:hypothetical protein